MANDSDKIMVSGGTTKGSTSTSKASHASVSSTPCPTKVTSDPVYSYKVKIINLNKKSHVAVFYLSGAFDSVTSLRVKLIETFKERVPSTLDFNNKGSQLAKTWLVTTDDLKTFYRKFPKGGKVILWCDG